MRAAEPAPRCLRTRAASWAVVWASRAALTWAATSGALPAAIRTSLMTCRGGCLLVAECSSEGVMNDRAQSQADVADVKVFRWYQNCQNGSEWRGKGQSGEDQPPS